MYTASVLFSLAPLFLSSILATPISSQDLTKKDSGPAINVIFFSDINCTTTVPPTIYTRSVYGDVASYFWPTELYQSLLIDHIDDQFIGTNSALQVGNTAGANANFTFALKYSIATKETVNVCQFIGIPAGQGKPARGGNEYRLTSLEG